MKNSKKKSDTSDLFKKNLNKITEKEVFWDSLFTARTFIWKVAVVVLITFCKSLLASN